MTDDVAMALQVLFRGGKIATALLRVVTLICSDIVSSFSNFCSRALW